jgi:hypothetical protein
MKQMKPEKIRTLKELRSEQARIREQIGVAEKDLGESWKYLKEHYKGMIWQQVNPFKKGSRLGFILDLVQPGLLPILAEVVKGGIKGNPLNLKVLGTTAQYAATTFGAKWLKKLFGKKNQDTDPGKNTDKPA